MAASRRGKLQASSSIGRAAVSKTAGWGFDSLLACHFYLFHSPGFFSSMNTKADAQSDDKLDVVKWLLAAVLLIAGLGGFYYFSDSSTLLRVLGLLSALAVAVGLVFTTMQGRRGWGFIQETQLEVRKVVWPSRQETIRTTGLVIVMVIIIALMIWIIDSILFWIVQTLTQR
jgi:preprotein translocase subunit SecE